MQKANLKTWVLVAGEVAGGKSPPHAGAPHLFCLPGLLLSGNQQPGSHSLSPLGPWAFRPVHSCCGELLFFSLLL